MAPGFVGGVARWLVGHKQVTALHLVNLAASHNARLVTLDTKIGSLLGTRDQHWVHQLS